MQPTRVRQTAVETATDRFWKGPPLRPGGPEGVSGSGVRVVRALKVLGVSPVAEFVANTVPFLPGDPFVLGHVSKWCWAAW